VTVLTNKEDNTLAIASLVCGILSLSTCGPIPMGLLAVGLGYHHNNKCAAAGQPKNSLATAGLITGMISLGIAVFSLLIAAGIVLLYLGFAAIGLLAIMVA